MVPLPFLGSPGLLLQLFFRHMIAGQDAASVPCVAVRMRKLRPLEHVLQNAGVSGIASDAFSFGISSRQNFFFHRRYYI